ncbi:MAG: hypothetical protein HOV79_02575 [Hamadaea sp.]|nr:hypothetical protein [Hamadaea sp.]
MRPREVEVADHWRLAADDYAQAAAVWRSLPARHGTAAQIWSARAVAVDERWSGVAAQTYAAHRAAIAADVGGCAKLAVRIADALDVCAAASAAARKRLVHEFAFARSVLGARTGGDGSVVFAMRSPLDTAGVQAAVTRAIAVRESLSRTLAEQSRVITSTVAEWERVATSWRSAAMGVETFTAPADPLGTQILRMGDRVVISTGGGDDQVRIHVDPATGQQVVVAGGGLWRFPAETGLVIRTGAGDDTVTVAPGIHVRLTLLGGDGADRLGGGDAADALFGLAGNDYLDGGRGDDDLAGGAGNDAVYGLAGDDAVVGGTGRDYLEGGAGSDTVLGGDEADVLSGGLGDDRISGGTGDDVIYTGRGADVADGGVGRDTAYAPTTATVTAERTVTVEIAEIPAEIRIEGSAEFAERVRADLEFLAASPTGQQMLAALDDGLVGRDTLTIREWAEDNAAAHVDASEERGKQRAIDYNPTFATFMGDTPPVVVLYHEMAHQYDFTAGTVLPGAHEDPVHPDGVRVGDRWVGVPTAERQAVGLPVDHDRDPRTPSQFDPRHPLVFTENGLRSELTWRPRTAYANPQ